ncbi:MAG: tRNA threonylcarbamoyladenosine dehydratase [Firmicutes bacterium]|nr:tRNA threonylcarbamoyladenosine dehydratase [Bacillota bacterium]
MNQFSRTETLLGKEALLRLRASSVIVFGLGGVGSYAAEALARGGVGRLAFVDGDTVSVTNINRQLVATHATVGRYKADVMRERALEINPEAEAETFRFFYDAETAGGIDLSRYSYAVDAIDSVASKLLIIRNAAAAGTPVISCMGAGNKLDPTKFEVADIYDTSVCPLAKAVRKELRAGGIGSLKVVYSREPVMPAADSGCGAKGNGGITPETGAKKSANKTIPGSVSFVPPVAGMILAGEVIKDIIGIR